jgi:protease II
VSGERTIGIAPPPVRREAFRRIVHGVELVDHYAWLRAANWREVLRDPAALPPEIRAHLDAENAYSDALLRPLAGLRERLREESWLGWRRRRPPRRSLRPLGLSGGPRRRGRASRGRAPAS